MAKPPNILLLITDQQRRPMYWPDEPGWLRQLMPNDSAIADTGLSFGHGFTATAMCSPSRATMLTSLYPTSHGVPLTLSAGDLHPNRRYTPQILEMVRKLMQDETVDRARLARVFTRAMFNIGPHSGNEPELPVDVPSMGRILGEAGYHVAYRGKWHLTHALGTPEETGLLSGWGSADSRRLEDEYGLMGWEPPDAGENTKAANFGGGNAGQLGVGWDEEYTRQVEAFLSSADLPEPFCLIVSLVNPHDVLGFPESYLPGGYRRDDFSDLEVDLPPTVEEDLSNKPDVHALMKLGATAYLGPVDSRADQLDYVNFYAHLHRVIDQKIGRVVDALGSPDDPESLRSRTVLVRIADHGELGMSHDGQRQKAFNAYEETINVPFVISNPILFPEPKTSGALVSLLDLLPTFVGISGANLPPSGLQGEDLAPLVASAASSDREAVERCPVDFGHLLDGPSADSVREVIHFTYDDHQASTALQENPGQPNRVRCARTSNAKWCLYFDPTGKRPGEWELYDLERDPIEKDNLVDYRTGEPLDPRSRPLRDEMSELLVETMKKFETAPPDGVADRPA